LLNAYKNRKNIYIELRNLMRFCYFCVCDERILSYSIVDINFDVINMIDTIIFIYNISIYMLNMITIVSQKNIETVYYCLDIYVIGNRVLPKL
jgi:hypothetical protein